MRYIILFLLFPLNGGALTRNGPVSAAMGNAGVAAINPAESSSLNPAGLPLVQEYHFGLFYSGTASSIQSLQSERGIVLTDGKADNIFPASINYSEKNWSTVREDIIQEKWFEISFGKFIVPGISLGFSVRHLTQNLNSKKRRDNVNGALGVLFVPTPNFNIGCVFDQLVNGDQAPNQRTPGFTAGLYYQINDFFRTRFDVTHEIKEEYWPTRIMAGIESYPYKYLPIRIGAQSYENQFLWTFGTGWAGPRLSFDYAIQTQQRPLYVVKHLLDVKLHF